jgi:hypothetical protein
MERQDATLQNIAAATPAALLKKRKFIGRGLSTRSLLCMQKYLWEK